VGRSLEAKIKRLQEYYWSDADPDGRGFVSLADAYRREGDSLEALRILRDGLRRHPELSSGHVVRAWVYEGQGNISDAEAAFRAALEVDSQNVAALRGLGDLLARQGAVSEALEVFRSLLPLDPLDTDLPRRVGELEAASEAVSEEAEPLPEVEERETPRVWEDPDRVAEELNWDAAALQADESSPPEAEEAFETPEVDEGSTALEQPLFEAPVKEDALVTRTMGEIFLRQGLLDEAEDVFQRLLVRDPEDRGLREKVEEVRARRRGDALPPWGLPEMTEEAAPEGSIPIQKLLADPIIPIGELAPELILSMDDLAPDAIVPIEALAPDPSQRDATLDAFETWLEKLS
jgi:tetratricopeptide (TPR) repeat protein